MMNTNDFKDMSLKYVKNPDEFRKDVFTQMRNSKDNSNISLFTRAANLDGLINEKVMKQSPSRFLMKHENMSIKELNELETA